MKNELCVFELIESFVNGNRNYVLDELFHNGTPASVALFFYESEQLYRFDSGGLSDTDLKFIVNGLQDRQFEANQKG